MDKFRRNINHSFEVVLLSAFSSYFQWKYRLKCLGLELFKILGFFFILKYCHSLFICEDPQSRYLNILVSDFRAFWIRNTQLVFHILLFFAETSIRNLYLDFEHKSHCFVIKEMRRSSLEITLFSYVVL
jgi:hypothetical protein